jgi:hypothetical protein
MILPSTADPHAASHAGLHGDFEIFWLKKGPTGPAGWYWYVAVHPFDRATSSEELEGPFATSQAAFGDRKDSIDRSLTGV